MIYTLKEKGFKLTPQRIEIVKALYNSGREHPTLNGLFDSIKRRMPTVSFSTLYNTISTLEKNGLVRLFDLRGETRIEMNPLQHMNLIDTRSREITDLGDEETIRKVLSELDQGKLKGRKVLINVLIY